jgi:hypothetical protein
MIGLGRQFISPQQNSGPLFVKNMKDVGAFKNGIFSVFLTLDPAPASSSSTPVTISANNIQSAYVQSFIEFGKSSMMVVANQTKWFQNLYYAQEWQVRMNAYKVDESGRLPNGT